MVTILDIAKEAKVSHGTVSNVLNKKGNVSVDKILRVETAAKKLGYSMNTTAKTLRKGENSIVAVILPNSTEIEYTQLYLGIKAKLSETNYEIKAYYTSDNEILEKSIIEIIAQERVNAVFTVSSLHDASYYYSEIALSKNLVFFINRKPQKAKQYISFDTKKIAQDIAAYFDKQKITSALLFTSRDTFEIEKKLITNLTTSCSFSLPVLHSEREEDYKNAFDIINTKENTTIFATSEQKARHLQKAMHFTNSHDTYQLIYLTTFSKNILEQATPYYLNYYQLGMEVATAFVEKNSELNVHLLTPNGFEKAPRYIETTTQTLNMLSIKSPTSEAILKLLPNFKSETAIDVKMDIVSLETFEAIINDTTPHNYDIIRLDIALLPWLSEKIYLPLSKRNQGLDKIINRQFDAGFEQYMKIKDEIYTLPLDPSVQMLFYRRDIFNNLVIKRSFFEQYGKALEVPQTFADLITISEFLTTYEYNKINGISLNAINPSIIAAEFFAIYYALGGTLQYKNKTIILDSKIGQAALNLYDEDYKIAKKEQSMWWDGSVNSFIHGDTAMIIGFSNQLSKIASTPIGVLSDYANVPGNKPLLGGGVIGISKDTTKVDASLNFLLWLNQSSILKEITFLGGTTNSPRVNTIQEIHQQYPWLDKISTSLSNGMRQTTLANAPAFNLRKVEDIIGKIIQEKNINNEKLAIETINFVLEKNKKQIF